MKEEKHENMLRWKEKSSTSKTNNTTQGDNSEGPGERRKTKKIPRLYQTKQTKQDILKQQKKILPTIRWRMHKDIPKTGCKGNKTIFEKNIETEIILQKSRMDKQHEQEISQMELKGENTPGFTQSYFQKSIELKNARWWWHTLIPVLKIPFHPRQTGFRN